MNIQKMLELADFLDTLPETSFDINYWGDSRRAIVCEEDLNVCGTTCCIAGWQVVKDGYCVTTAGDVFLSKDGYESCDIPLGTASSIAGRSLGLDLDLRSDLFYESRWPSEFWESLSPEEAIKPKPSPKIAAKRIRFMVNNGY